MTNCLRDKRQQFILHHYRESVNNGMHVKAGANGHNTGHRRICGAYNDATSGLHVINTGTITGNIGAHVISSAGLSALPSGAGSTIMNQLGGVLAPYDTIDLGENGRLRNAGTIEVGGARSLRARPS